MSNNSSNNTSGSKIITTVIAVIVVLISAFFGGDFLNNFTAESRESVEGLENVTIQTRKILYCKN